MPMAKLSHILSQLTASAFVIVALADVGRAQSITLKAVTPWMESHPASQPMVMFQRMVADRLKDKLTIRYLGGPEVVPEFQQFEAVRNGVVDVILGAGGYYDGVVPEATATLAV